MRQNARSMAFGGIGAAALIVFVLREFPPAEFALYPTCPVHRFLGLLCPGCGGTRAVAALCSGEWAAAFRENALVTASMPMAFGYAAAQAYSGVRWNRWLRMRVPTWATWAMLCAAACFAAIRNS